MSVLEFQFENEFEIEARLSGITSQIENEVAETIALASEELAAFIISEKLSGQVLQRQTGKLQESIRFDGVTRTSDTISGSVIQDDSIASYGVIHEFGGDIPGRSGHPMHWINEAGEDVYAQFAKGFTLPERSFMRSALEEFAPHVEEMLILAVARGIGE